MNINRFEIKNLEIDNKNKKYLSFENYSNNINDSNFIVFNSFQVENMIIFEVFYKREEHFNKPNESEYEYWRRMNGGVSYYFKFDKNNFLIDFKKKMVLL
ncbi:hypothetical protein H9X57_13055 [Flavobacterium piscinae]|uniref:hypothetical protein n=1 Tax=Flavobacterium piscinae TaxID=2506424 RepID=UPI0019C917F1|nr:hypothetical protein [Flavobacterium piscinae]MBC8883946.1 hypothetical protein [Flavobacterium piscinae]